MIRRPPRSTLFPTRRSSDLTVQPVTTIAGAPIAPAVRVAAQDPQGNTVTSFTGDVVMTFGTNTHGGLLSGTKRSEEQSELQSRLHLVCRLLLEKKKKWYPLP